MRHILAAALAACSTCAMAQQQVLIDPLEFMVSWA